MKNLGIAITLLSLCSAPIWSENRSYIDDNKTFRRAPDGFSYTAELDDNMGFKALCRQILRMLTEMRTTQLEILKHEKNIDENIKKLADKLAP